jgi:hypothetical protein
MASRVVFIDTLPTELRNLVEPHHVLIAGGITEANIYRELFFREGEDYVGYLSRGGVPNQELADFIERCMDWIDGAGSEGVDVHYVFKGVAKDLINNWSDPSLAESYLARLVQDAIASK